jgi:hypothetical protein
VDLVTLVEQVDHLRGLVQADQSSSLLDMAVCNILEELAAEVDRLVAEHPPPPGVDTI